MIEGLIPYEQYKDTSLPWVGQVPAHWDVRRGKALFAESSLPIRAEDDVVTCFRDGQVTLRKNRRTSGFMVALFEAGYQGIRKGQLVIHSMDAFAGAIGISESDGKCTPEYIVADHRAFGTFPGYYARLLRFAAHQGFILVSCPAVRERAPRFRYSHFGDMLLPCPPPDEQAAIVQFLNHANRKIDAFIQGKGKLISLLEEQKQAIIHRAVTRGLNLKASFKPSGVAWLGDIPEHWTLKRFKFLARINSGQVDPRDSRFKNLVLIAPNHIQTATGRLLSQETARQQSAGSGKYFVSKGQIIYCKIRPNLRKAVISPCDCLCSADMYPITPRNDILTEFFLLLLLSQPFTKFAVDASMRVAMPKVNREALADCLLWYPSHNEQRAILEFVSRESSPYDVAVARAQREIALMQEYRTRLTADVVTGKLDVRAAASRLPDSSFGGERPTDGERFDELESMDENTPEDP